MTKLQSAARWYVYALSDPRDGAVFYVGKGCGNRMHRHEVDAAKVDAARSRKIDRIRAITGGGLDVQKQVYAQFWDEQAAYDHETDLIEEIGLANLTNVLPGGQKAWVRRKLERQERRRKERPPETLYEMIAKKPEALLDRMADWFKFGGHKGTTVQITDNRLGMKPSVILSEYTYNKFFPWMWEEVQSDARALRELKTQMRPFGVEIEYASA